MPNYSQHGRRHHPRYGTDPIADVGIDNHFVEASGGFNVASDGGAPATPTPVAVDVAIIRQSSGSEPLYFITAGAVDYLTIALPGTYTVKAFASFPDGMTGYIDVTGVIAGDVFPYTVLAPRFAPASYPGAVGGGYVEWEQTIEVLDTAVVGTATEVSVYPAVWQNSGSSRVGSAYIQVLRHT